ncbi:PIN domain-containing protein [Arsenicibacter rosenii]|uniref:Nuclease n=1 Tax=Arsenicibacter rosenii TaxID=1750698 RepID=A0A1S2VE97_9BACT|nr:PIN domain-containing protein [Arsenicibacter rosenii]OIN57043.1 nuclease [Arsenicibacter rosenii]
MIHSVRFTAVLDTNVVFPVVIRDLLFWFAYYDLYTPKWSRTIFDEWQEVMIRKGISEPEAAKRVNKANLAFPDALVRNYESLIPTLALPDEKDRHVLAAAIRANANIIVTNNLKDFPDEYLATFDLKAVAADDFLTDIIDLNHDKALRAFKELVLNKRNPAMDEFAVLESFRRNGLINTANYLHALL